MCNNLVNGMLTLNFPPIFNHIKISCPADCVEFFTNIWDKELFNIQEQVYVLFLNEENNIITWRHLNTGSANASIVDTKLVIAIAITCLASKIVIAHNHPLGSPTPSKEDITLTRKIIKAASCLDVSLVDHIILSNNGYYSFMEHQNL